MSHDHNDHGQQPDRVLVQVTNDRAYLKRPDGIFYLHERTIYTYYSRTERRHGRAPYTRRTFTAWTNLGEPAKFTDIPWAPEGPGIDYQPEAAVKLPAATQITETKPPVPTTI
jgi:hypothetical protein